MIKKIVSITALLISATVIAGTFSNIQTGQQEEDRLIRLITAKSAEVIQDGFKNLKKVTGPAQFLHNDTYIICDTAIWDVTQNTLDAKGNVKIIQNQTTLFSDYIHYIANQSLAQIRGHLVELVDKDKNRLRTNLMDFYTKDSVAFFFEGGCVMDSSNNIIESYKGSYDAKIKEFRFYVNVQISNDSLLMTTDTLTYVVNEDKLIFEGPTNAWKGGEFLQAHSGWYSKRYENYHFSDRAYICSADQEIWANTIKYNRRAASSTLFDNIQITDSKRSTLIFGDYANYNGKSADAIVTKNPSVGYFSMDNGVADTLFLKADTLKVVQKRVYELDSATIAMAKERLELALKDPFKVNYSTPAPTPPQRPTMPQSDSITNIPDSTIIARSDSSAIAKADSSAISDSLATPALDTTKVNFMYAYHNVKIYRKDIQGSCDSLIFTTLDSIARMYKQPLLWNEESQFSSDSIQFIIKDRTIHKAEFLSNAFIISEEDSIHYNQIKATDMAGYFKNNEISRFDALGGASVLFFFREDSVITAMNKKECKRMTATLVDKKLKRVVYVEDIPSDVFPIFELKEQDMKLKGFALHKELRPKNRFEVCTRKVKPSRRLEISDIPQPQFPETKRYFPERATKEDTKKADPEDLPESK